MNGQKLKEAKACRKELNEIEAELIAISGRLDFLTEQQTRWALVIRGMRRAYKILNARREVLLGRK